jgi:hypothetical protein
MDLQKTIAGLEAQAAQYTEAANTLRALVEKNVSKPQPQPAAAKATPGRKAGVKQSAGKAAKKDGRSKRGPVSQETRDKIAAAIKARHAEKKAQAQAENQAPTHDQRQEQSV